MDIEAEETAANFRVRSKNKEHEFQMRPWAQYGTLGYGFLELDNHCKFSRMNRKSHICAQSPYSLFQTINRNLSHPIGEFAKPSCKSSALIGAPPPLNGRGGNLKAPGGS